MSDYISRDAALECFGDVPMWTGYNEPYSFEVHMALAGIAKVIRDIIAQIPAADVEPVRHWIPCSERLPEDGELVLTYKNERFEVQEYEKRRNGWISGGWFWSFGTVTHWMPLPEPPKEGGNKNAAD